MTAMTVIAERPADVRNLRTAMDVKSQATAVSSENIENHTVVESNADLRPHRSANQPPTRDPRNMPTKAIEVM